MSKTKKYIITAAAVIGLLYVTLIPKRVWIYVMNEKKEPVHVSLTYNDKVIIDEMMEPSYIIPYRYKGTGTFGMQDVQLVIDGESFDMSVVGEVNITVTGSNLSKVVFLVCNEPL